MKLAKSLKFVNKNEAKIKVQIVSQSYFHKEKFLARDVTRILGGVFWAKICALSHLSDVLILWVMLFVLQRLNGNETVQFFCKSMKDDF